MTAKLACQQSYTHLSNFTGALVLLPNVDQGYGASLPFWKPQGEIRESLSAALFKQGSLTIGWFPMPQIETLACLCIFMTHKVGQKRKKTRAHCTRNNKVLLKKSSVQMIVGVLLEVRTSFGGTNFSYN